ncbi:MAG: hypothetical protein F2813_00790 [Actinobacteria bacterium]|uniref:Unannotated protein n=1 Tax=freshwater metagenome TaxID=449393 RepID=A0A6J5Z3B0_9ZZZZ|nr:hypothetical protein [Actinomycetota bacterium]
MAPNSESSSTGAKEQAGSLEIGEAAAAVGFVIALQLSLAIVCTASGWELWLLPAWAWVATAVPEAILLGVFVVRGQIKEGELPGQTPRRRKEAILLVGLISLANALALMALLGELLSAQVRTGTELLFEAGVIWTTNVIAFGLLYWELDRGGPSTRAVYEGPIAYRGADFQFPQMENPDLAEKTWRPLLPDYMYIAFTTATAFSPTDAMPLTRRAKAVMTAETALSAITVLLVAARAVNILG